MTITLLDSLLIFIISLGLIFFVTRHLEKRFSAFHLPAWMVPKLERDPVLLYMQPKGRVQKITKMAEVRDSGAYSHKATRTKLHWLGIEFGSYLKNVKPLAFYHLGEGL